MGRAAQLLLWLSIQVQAARAQDNITRTKNNIARTINDCLCNKEWADKSGNKCENYCCQFSGTQKWCEVEDEECEDAEWGFCREAAAAEPVPIAGCADTEGWRDLDGDGCTSYEKKQWCTKDGQVGKGWHEEWGNPKTFNANGYTAFAACCACGGGKKGAAANPLAQRFTFSGCRCKKKWQDGANQPSCDTSCCNPDEDPAGAWCLVEEEACESSYWGYCRPEEDKLEQLTTASEQHGNCDDDKGWTDVDEETCQAYASKAFCTEVGGYGLGWNLEWGTFQEFAKPDEEDSAIEACCACGGGSRMDDEGPGEGTDLKDVEDTKVQTTLSNCACKKSWKLDGFGECDQNCCNPDKDKVGDWCMVQDPTCEDSDWGYCKQSGLGLETVARGPLQDAAHCSDVLSWTDADGDGCQKYATSLWCTANRKTGPGWHEEWGAVSDGAFTSCCACGGGTVGEDEDKKEEGFTQDAMTQLKNLVNEMPEFMWWIASGPCAIDDHGCITSGNFPNKYGALEECQIGVDVEKAVPIHVKYFETERKYDALKVNNEIYSGSRAPNGIIPSSTIFWGADSKDEKKGWKLCPRGEVQKRKPGVLVLKVLGVGMMVILCSCCVAFGGLWIHTYRTMPTGDGLGAGPTKMVGKRADYEEA